MSKTLSPGEWEKSFAKTNSYQTVHQTDGINVSNFILKPENDEVHVNLWDLGGQVEYMATHPFFFDEDAIYLLVFDISKFRSKSLSAVYLEIKTNLQVFIQSITSSHPNPQVILVGTKNDEGPSNVRQMLDYIKRRLEADKALKLEVKYSVAVSSFVDPGDNATNPHARSGISKLRCTLCSLHKQIFKDDSDTTNKLARRLACELDYDIKAKASTIYKEVPFSLIASVALFFMAYDTYFSGASTNIISR